jgi:hypothetical protein
MKKQDSKYFHIYNMRIPPDVWEDLVAVSSITTKSVGALLNEGARLVVQKTRENISQYRQDSAIVRTAAVDFLDPDIGPDQLKDNLDWIDKASGKEGNGK